MRMMRLDHDRFSRELDAVVDIIQTNQRLRDESEQLVRETRQLRADAAALVAARRTHAEVVARLRHAA